MLIDQITPAAYAAFATEFDQYETVYNAKAEQMVIWGNVAPSDERPIRNFFAKWELEN